MREIRCQFVFSGKNDELNPDFPISVKSYAAYKRIVSPVPLLFPRLFHRQGSLAEKLGKPEKPSLAAPAARRMKHWHTGTFLLEGQKDHII